MGKCAGERFAAFSGVGILSSYLVLFISFYLATYKRDGKPSGRKAVRRMSQVPLPDPNQINQIIHGKASSGNTNGTNGNGKSSAVKSNGTSTRSRRA